MDYPLGGRVGGLGGTHPAESGTAAAPTFAFHSLESSVRLSVGLLFSLLVIGQTAEAQRADSSSGDKTFLVQRDLAITGAALAGTGALSYFDPRIARWSQRNRTSDPTTGKETDGLSKFSRNVSKVNETTLTVAGIVAYGAGRLLHAPTFTDIALHSTESVVLSSIASQLIRGPLGRTRPYVSHDSDQYKFKAFRGFYGDSSFDYRAFPSIHTSSSMAIATVITMETHRRHPEATKFVAPVLFAAGMLPGLARIRLDQHWSSDVAAGAFMGVFAGYKVVGYSHAHPDNRFDRMFLAASVLPNPHGGMTLAFNPTF
jgi:membrane-associated phospholipid phosphatase